MLTIVTNRLKKLIFSSTIMNFKTLITLSALPLAIFAQESNAVSNEVIIEEKLAVTESEFSGDSTIDAADAGNVADTASTDSAAEAAVDAANAEKVAENIASDMEQQMAAEEIVEPATVAATDATIASAEGAEADSTDAEDGAEMSQEEADAELAAASSDSTGTVEADSVIKDLQLDMTTAFVPTFSRRISSPYGVRTYRMHRGVDLGLCQGEDRTILAPFPGKVIKVRNQGRRKGYGKYVVMEHDNGLVTTYAHLANWKVKVGDVLQAGDTIGIGGNTGRSFGAHLHFEIKYHGMPVDPNLLFNFAEGTFREPTTTIQVAQLQQVEAENQRELSKHRYYKVRRGDCLGKIARKYGISITRLKQLNHIKGNMIRPGQILKCS